MSLNKYGRNQNRMPIKFVKGDMFSTPMLTSYAHGCNCAGAMGKGVAVEFKKRWPRMFLSYKEKCKSNLFNPGDVFMWQEQGITVFNLGTQKSWRTKATLNAVENSLLSMLDIAEENSITHIGVPRIGAGLGGLLWEDVKSTLFRVSDGRKVNLIVFEDFVLGLDATNSIIN